MDADLKKSETIKSKVDELRTRYEAVQKESTRLREEISRL
jgi:predicted nuclease with TOPRIM domain